MIGDKTGAQVILSGQIRDMKVTKGFFKDTRQLEVEIYLHDAVSGTRLARHRFSETIKDAGFYKTKTSLFSNSSFYQTVYGKVLDKVLTSQAELISEDIKQIPFAAKILKIDGTKVFFNAGASSLVNIGDTLMTYRLDPDPLTDLNDQFLGNLETPVATLSVEQVQPQFAVGKMEIKNAKLLPGDIVRFGR